MKSTLRSQSGITLVILVITMVVLAILSVSIVTIVKNNINNSKIHSFVTELEIIEKKMYVINKEISLGSTAYEDIGTKYDDIEDVYDEDVLAQVETVLEQSGVVDYSNYRYLSEKNGDLLKLGLKNIAQDVIISYDNSVVYSYDGILIDGKLYYTIEEVQTLISE